MKVLLDMNLAAAWTTFLSEADIPATHWSTVGAADAADTEVMQYAAARGFIVLTHDLDFGIILAAFDIGVTDGRRRGLDAPISLHILQSMIAREDVLASITIRNLDEALKRKLRLRAAHRNTSMEDEARDILRTALSREASQAGNLADAIRARIEPLGGVELCLPPREMGRDPPKFE